MIVRKFRKEDAKNVWKVMKKSIKIMVLRSGDVYSFWDFYYFSPRVVEFLSHHREIYVAEEDGRIVGTAGLDGGSVLGVYVHPRFSGKGIGGKLLKKLEEVAKKRGCKELRTLAALGAVDFYEKVGFKIDVKISHFILMRKKLK